MERRFEDLVNAHGDRLYQLASLMLGRCDEAEDVVQDSLVKLWDRLSEIETGRELPWLIICTRNACLDRLRRRSRQRGLLQVVAGRARIAARERDLEQGPARVHERSQATDRLHAALARLPEPGRSLLILRDIQELDVSTVARTLDLSQNQVKVYTFRARRKLREALEEELHEQVA
jgi:RNA polymerase sigma-70 factor (ECF subfamily)